MSVTISATPTPPAACISASKTDEKGDSTEALSKTASLRRYGPPSGVRVVSALARFSTSSSARARCADMPEAPTDSTRKETHALFPSSMADRTARICDRIRFDAI